jgi:HD-GYP domain-containing protein (c-di-GMP phosphodiesterase class II)
MSNLELLYPVYTLDNKSLLPAGSVLSEETLNILVSSNRDPDYQESSLLQYGSIKKDMLQFLIAPPYNVIFADEKEISGLLRLMENIKFISPILQSLDYFKQYDFYTYRHLLMVFALSTLLSIDLISDYRERLREIAAGPTHDIGKICVPLNILKKTTPVTQTELNKLKHHAVASYVLLSYYLRDAGHFSARAARDHHEKKDGEGYPGGIRLEDLMIEIVAVSDVYDALISPRPYRPASYENRATCEEITEMAERGEINWEVVKTLIAHIRRSRPQYDKCIVSKEKRGIPPSINFHGVIAEEGNPSE